MISYFSKRRLKKHDLNNNRKLQSAVQGALLQQNALHSSEPGVGNTLDHEIVVSLTSYEKRIGDAYLCVESLLQQSLRPDRIILWLSRSNFPNGKVPALLRKQESRGLEIIFTDEDLGPYKKYVYALERFPRSLVITVDDDILYPVDMVEQLYDAWLENPETIQCHRAHAMRLDKPGQLAPYRKWASCPPGRPPSSLVFPTGVCGVLYFPGALHEDATNRDQFLRLCPMADDIWLKAMSLKNGTLSAVVDDPRYWKDRFLTITGSQCMALKQENWKRGRGNDEKLAAVFAEYDLFAKLAR